jgi:hypothetical protein
VRLSRYLDGHRDELKPIRIRSGHAAKARSSGGAAAAFMQWRAKPHLIDHAILPVNFVGAPEESNNNGIKW